MRMVLLIRVSNRLKESTGRKNDQGGLVLSGGGCLTKGGRIEEERQRKAVVLWRGLWKACLRDTFEGLNIMLLNIWVSFGKLPNENSHCPEQDVF